MRLGNIAMGSMNSRWPSVCPPHALLIPDPEAIAPFRAASDRAHNWHRGPNRTLEVLPKFSAASCRG